jgi:hypothetical protein
MIMRRGDVGVKLCALCAFDLADGVWNQRLAVSTRVRTELRSLPPAPINQRLLKASVADVRVEHEVSQKRGGPALRPPVLNCGDV